MNNKYKAIDLFKFIMAFLVVAIHTDPFINVQSTYFYRVWGGVTSLAVPFFFVAAGFLLKEKIISNTKCTFEILFGYVHKIIKLYILWNIIYLPLAIWNYLKANMSFEHCILDYIRGLILYGEHYNSYVLWYLLSTIYALLFVIFLSRIRIDERIILFIGFFIMMAGVILTIYSQGKLEECLILDVICKILINGRIFMGFFYIPLGMYLNGKIKNEKKSLAVVILLVTIILRGFTINLVLGEFIKLLQIIIIFKLVVSMSLDNVKYDFSKLRHYSTTIYFIHLWVWTIAYSILYKEKVYGLLMWIVTSAGSMLVAITTNKLQKRRMKI